MSASPSKRRIMTLGVLTTTLLFGQDWQTAVTLPAVDFTGLTAARKTTALKLLRNQDCTCGCGMKLAECRVKDPGCVYSKGVAAALVGAIKEGKNEAGALAAAKASKFGQAPAPLKILEDPITIPTTGSPVQGRPDAPITIVEFSDFQCPYCFKAFVQLNAVLKAYPTQVKLIFKQYPLDTHSQAALAAAAALAAHRQGKFWPMHDIMFHNRQNLSRPAILALATREKLDLKRFTADFDSPETQKAVARDREDGDRAGVTGTPTIFINGQHYNGVVSLEALRSVIDAELKRPAGKK